MAEVVPEPSPGAWLLAAWPGRAAGPDVYDDLLPVTDRLISGWQARPDGTISPSEPEADLELELLPGRRIRSRPRPHPKEQPMGTWNSSPKTAADPSFTWFYDKPLPYTLTPEAEAALDDPEPEADR